MWIASKEFSYRNKRYVRGEEVPATNWPGRSALVALRRIHFVPEEVVETPSVDINKLKRADLDAHASSLGIENPADHPNRASLIEAITNLNQPTSGTGTDGSSTTESTGSAGGGNDSSSEDDEDAQESGAQGSNDPSGAPVDSSEESPIPVVEDDLFADPK